MAPAQRDGCARSTRSAATRRPHRDDVHVVVLLLQEGAHRQPKALVWPLLKGAQSAGGGSCASAQRPVSEAARRATQRLPAGLPRPTRRRTAGAPGRKAKPRQSDADRPTLAGLSATGLAPLPQQRSAQQLGSRQRVAGGTRRALARRPGRAQRAVCRGAAEKAPAAARRAALWCMKARTDQFAA